MSNNVPPAFEGTSDYQDSESSAREEFFAKMAGASPAGAALPPSAPPQYRSDEFGSTASTISLPRGFQIQGVFEKTVRLHQLTGFDEEALARIDVRVDPMGRLKEAVRRGISHVGHHNFSEFPESTQSALVDGLLGSEVGILLQNIAADSFGGDQPVVYKCDHCETELETVLHLVGDCTTKVPETLGEGLYEFEDRGQTFTFRLLTQGDDVEIGKLPPSEMTSNAIARMLVLVNGERPLDETAKLHAVRSMSVGTRQRLRDAHNAHLPTIDTDVRVQCSCGKYNMISIHAAGLIFRL